VALHCKFTKALTFENSEFRIPPKYRMGVAWRAQFDPALGEAVVRQRAYNVSFLFSLSLSLSLARARARALFLAAADLGASLTRPERARERERERERARARARARKGAWPEERRITLALICCKWRKASQLLVVSRS
jgi:hypothetical protein